MSDIIGSALDLVGAYNSLHVLAHSLANDTAPSIEAVRALRQQAEQVEKLHDSLAGIKLGVPTIETPDNPTGTGDASAPYPKPYP